MMRLLVFLVAAFASLPTTDGLHLEKRKSFVDDQLWHARRYGYWSDSRLRLPRLSVFLARRLQCLEENLFRKARVPLVLCAGAKVTGGLDDFVSQSTFASSAAV
jgi:hypothetical protein